MVNTYRIILARPGAGFFSNFLQVVGYLSGLEGTDNVPVVYFNRLFLYWSPSGYEGRMNGWEYYFEPIIPEINASDLLGINDADLQIYEGADFRRISMEAAKKKIHFNSTYWVKATGWRGKFNDEQRRNSARIVKKYVRLQESVLKRYESTRARIFDGRDMVGVHYRGTDKGGEIKGMGYPFIGINKYLEETDFYLKSHEGSYVFLATDLESALTTFKKRYGQKLIYVDARRSVNGRPVHKHGAIPKVGEEALMDALLLSSAKALICGYSHLTAAAAYFNINLEVKNVYCLKGS